MQLDKWIEDHSIMWSVLKTLCSDRTNKALAKQTREAKERHQEYL